ncbi:MAG TPA: M20/M25/M40 family metallo-hydrolase [Methylomirabilota bacterium]|jgi:acetylornithine deacetylase/succinyl-diaminopimelate desuccinylase-like protein
MIDWTALGREAVELLRAYLRIDTTNPPGNEIAGARFLADVLAREGIASETVESAPGRANLVARLSGDGSLGAIVLHHHIDVVYADRRYWSVDPFGGEIRDGFLYGRGAIDMKSTGILQLAAMLALRRANTRLKRDLIFLATADEEAGSAYGAGFLAAHHADWLHGAEYAVSELGGIEVSPHYRAPFAHIVISEKTGLPLRLIARGAPGHGSMPWPDTAPHRLIRALGRLLATERPPRVLPEVQEYFRCLARVLPADEGRGFESLETSLRDPAFRARFFARREWAAMVRTTFAVNILRASEKLNVIPPEAVAELDCRMMAGDDPDEIRAWVTRAVDDEHVEVALAREPKIPNLSPPDTELYKALADALARRVPGVVVAPEILVAFTDNWVFRRMGLQGYGWSPFVLDDGEWRRVHGNDERISLENVEHGARAYTELLLAVAGA